MSFDQDSTTKTTTIDGTGVRTPPLFKLAALGDSISTAFNARQSGDNPDHSWATGTAEGVASHRARLTKALPFCDVEAKNFAVAGSRASQLAGQAQLAAAFAPDYATLLVCANDLSEWVLASEYGVRLDQFGADVASAVQRLVQANPRVMILLAGVPDQARVIDFMLKRSGFKASTAPWLDAQLLPSLRRAYKERHERMAAALSSVAGANPANVRFAAGVGRARFDAEHLSELDAYHPSSRGQSLLAGLTWREGWFP
jgi:lysophospholipase L1-like esterase